MAVQLSEISSHSFRKGELVWVRSSSSSWQPALFLRKESDNQYLVMFFALKPPKYISLPNICPFDENFKAHFTKTDPSLVNDALAYLTNRVGSSLECRCNEKGKRKTMNEINGAWSFDESIAKERNLFDPIQVLRFVCRIAVRPWIEDEDIVRGIRGVEQVKGFWSAVFVKRRQRNWDGIKKCTSNIQPGTTMKCTSSRLKQFSSTSVEVASLTLDVEDECQGSSLDTAHDGASESSMSLEDNLKSGVRSELVLDSGCHNHDEGDVHITDIEDTADCSQSMVRRSDMVFYSNDLEFLHQKLMNLHHLAVDLFCLEEESLKALRYGVLKFRSWSHQYVNGVLLEKHPSRRNLESPSSFGYDCRLKSQSADRVFHRMKRQLSHYHVYEPLKLQKTLFPLTNRSSLCRITSLSDKDLSDSFFPDSLAKHQVVRYQATGPNNLDAISCGQYPCPIKFLKDVSSIKEASLRSTVLATGSVSEVQDCRCAMNKNRMSGYHNFIQKVKFRKPTADRKTDPRHNLVLPSGVGSLFTAAVVSRPDAIFIPTVSAGDKAIYISHNCSTPIKISNEVQTETVPVNCKFHKPAQVSEDDKKLHHSGSSNLSSVSQRDKVSKLQGGATSLVMKFPKEFNLPSKDELVRKFFRFGSVDIMQSKVYSSSGSARVVFFKQIDAVTAYQYAKRKKVLGPAKIRFWLDPSEYGRKAGKPQVQLSKKHLKPCLRKPNSPKNEARKKSQRVRFSL